MLLLPGNQPNGIVGGRGEDPAPGRQKKTFFPISSDGPFFCFVLLLILPLLVLVLVPALSLPAEYADLRLVTSYPRIAFRPPPALRRRSTAQITCRPHSNADDNAVNRSAVGGGGETKRGERNTSTVRDVRVRRLTTVRYYVIVKNSSTATTRVHENIDSSCRVRAYCELQRYTIIARIMAVQYSVVCSTIITAEHV
jgi:hypothetical protein